jgi:beta-lactamase superfamily II metal-dependent hydrolase
MTRVLLAAALALIAGCAGSPDSRSVPSSREPLSNTAPVRVAAPAADRQKKGDPPRSTCYVDFIDVGTGLAVLVRCRDDAERVLNILYDGGSNDPALRNKNRLVYMLDKGLGFAPGATIHHLFQSHAHFDHHSELIRDGGVIDKYDVKNVWDPAAINDTVAYGCFITSVVDKANATNLVYHPARKCPDFGKLRCDGARIPKWKTEATSVKPFDAPARDTPAVAPFAINLGFTGITAKILHADPTVNDRHLNDSSLVLKLELFGVKLLLTGDEEAGRERKPPDKPPADKSVEKFLLDNADLSANIVQVPHHGSETSSTDELQKATLLKVREKSDTFAVISSGPWAYSGTVLPDASVVESWRKKLGRSHVLLTTINDKAAPACSKNADKIAPTPAADETPAGCNNVEFVIEDRARGRKITSIAYWPIGPR